MGRMYIFRIKTMAFLFLLLLTSFQEKPKEIAIDPIESFARLYGYARWFHPSDEAQEIDWDRFAVLGVQKVKNIQTTNELKDTLLRLFSPIVPGIQINETGNFDNIIPTMMDAKVVAWQHYGVDFGNIEAYYSSIRSNIFTNNRIVGKIFDDVTKLKGEKIKISGYLKKNETEHKGTVALYISPIFYDLSRPLVNRIDATSTMWENYELTMTVPEQTFCIEYGIIVSGDIEVWADDLQLLVENNGIWEIVEDKNMGFENSEISDDGYLNGDWTYKASHYDVDITDSESFSGKYSLKATYKGVMFDEMPGVCEAIQELIGENLYCYVPLSLYTSDGISTYPRTNIEELNRLKNELAKININKNEFNSDVNIASIIVAWNVFQHFFPYFDEIETKWEKELKSAIKNTLECTNSKEFTLILRKMIAQLQDGHGGVTGERMYYLPFTYEYIEDHIVVISSNDRALQRGDFIKKMGGRSASEVLYEFEQSISGSPQYKKAMSQFGVNHKQEEIVLEIERNKHIHQVTVNTVTSPMPLFKGRYSEIVELEPEIFYINLSDNIDFEDRINELAKAKAVIYDFRYGGSRSFFKIIPHLTLNPMRFSYEIPQIIYPNRKGWINKNININEYVNPKTPTFQSQSIVIISSLIISAGETITGLLDYYDLAVTVGEATAGCNGSVNVFSLPCGNRAFFTGMKVFKHDGSQLYLKGYEPDYPVSNTIEALVAGRDLYLEKALEIARRE